MLEWPSDPNEIGPNDDVLASLSREPNIIYIRHWFYKQDSSPTNTHQHTKIHNDKRKEVYMILKTSCPDVFFEWI